MHFDTTGAVLADQYLVWWIAQLVALAILVILFLRWRPKFLQGRTIGTTLNNSLEARSTAIKEQLELAERNRQEAEQLRQRAAADIEQARAQATEIVERAAHTGEAIQSEIEQRARDEYQRIISQARSEIDYERQQAEAALRRQAADIAVDAARQIIAGNLEPQTDQRLIETSLAQLRNGQ